MRLRRRRSRDLDAVGRFVGSLRVVAPLPFAPAAVPVLAFGVWMVIDSPAWDFGQRWVQFAIGIVILAVLLGAGFLILLLIAATWDMVVKPGV